MLEFLAKTSDFIGILGVFLLLFSYFLLNTDKISSKSLKYQFLNFFGAGFIMYSLLFHFNLPAFAIEVAWMTISLIGIFRITTRKKTTKM